MIAELFLLPLQSTIEQAKTQLGEPVQTTAENGSDILWYDSVVPDYATHYFFQSSKLERIAVNTNKQQLTVGGIEAELGKPVWVVRRFSAVDDALNQVLMVWPEKGYSVMAVNSGASGAKVIRVEQFSARTLEEYKGSLGSQYVANEEVKLESETQQEQSSNETTAIVVPSVPKQAKSSVFSTDVIILIVVLVAVLVVGIGMFLSTKRKKPLIKKQQPPEVS